MTRLLSIVSLVLAIILFPPAVLAVVSNNAVPGDSTYPIKRGLEDIIFAAASLTPATKVWFAAARSDRRFQEVTVLIAQGKRASETLNELVEQTQVTATQIDKVSDPAEKAKLIKQLSESITKYDIGLSQVSASVQSPPPITISSASTPQPSSAVAAQPVISPAAGPQISPNPKPVVPQSSSTPASIPAATPVPAAVVPSPSPVSAPGGRNSDIDKAREELKKIKEKLEQKSQNQGIDGKEEKDEKPKQEKRKDNSRSSQEND